MIQVTRAGRGQPFALNCDIIEQVKPAGDDLTGESVITTVDGASYRVTESMAEVCDLVRDFRASILATADVMAAEAASPQPTLRVVPSPED